MTANGAVALARMAPAVLALLATSSAVGCGGSEPQPVEAPGAPCAFDEDCAQGEACAVGGVSEVELEPGDAARCTAVDDLIGSAPTEYRFVDGGRPLADRLCLAGGLNRGAGAESDAIRARQLELIAASGAKVMRMDFPWAVIEPSEGQLDFSQLDPAVDAAGAAGVDVIGIIAYGVPWASSLTDTDPMYPPDDPADYARYARTLAEHFLGRVRRWELWNEPNGGWRFFRPKLHGDAAHYARMMVAAADAIHEVCADCEVISAGLFVHSQVVNGAVEFTHDMLSAEPAAVSAVDAFGYHPYPLYPPTAPPEQDAGAERSLAGMLNDLDAVLAAHGVAPLPYAATELGWPSFDQVDEDAQAAFLARSVLLGAALGSDPLCWFTLADGPNFGKFPPEDDFGLYRWGSADPGGVIAAKPARDALGQLAQLGQGAVPAGASDVGAFHDPGAGRFALDFDKPGGSWTALWQTTEPASALHLQAETRRAVDLFGAPLAEPGPGGLEVSVGVAPLYLVAP